MAFRSEAVGHFDKTPEVPIGLLGFASFLSSQGLVGSLCAALRASRDRGGAAPPERCGAGPVALDEIQRRQIVDASKRVGMLRPKCPLAAGERALEKRLGLAMAASS